MFSERREIGPLTCTGELKWRSSAFGDWYCGRKQLYTAPGSDTQCYFVCLTSFLKLLLFSPRSCNARFFSCSSGADAMLRLGALQANFLLFEGSKTTWLSLQQCCCILLETHGGDNAGYQLSKVLFRGEHGVIMLGLYLLMPCCTCVLLCDHFRYHSLPSEVGSGPALPRPPLHPLPPARARCLAGWQGSRGRVQCNPLQCDCGNDRHGNRIDIWFICYC